MNVRLLVLALLIAPPVCMAASFDCAKASTRVEVLICTSPSLSQQDERLADAYRMARARSATPGTITRWQRDWLKSSTLTACQNFDCVSKEYSARIGLLEQVSEDVEEIRWSGNYARAFGGKVDPTAKITIIRLRDNKILISGSAYWVGANPGQVNTGEIDGQTAIAVNRAVFDFDGCKGELSIQGERLVVESESGCGGLNVSFIGKYTRQRQD